jgi:hypothetical protein
METRILNNQADFMVKFPDGTIASGKPRFEAYKAAIQKIGIDRVAKFAQTSKLKRYGQPYINKQKNPVLEEGSSKDEFQNEEDEYIESEGRNELENEDFNLDEYISDDEVPDYRLYANNYSK